MSCSVRLCIKYENLQKIFNITNGLSYTKWWELWDKFIAHLTHYGSRISDALNLSYTHGNELCNAYMGIMLVSNRNCLIWIFHKISIDIS